MNEEKRDEVDWSIRCVQVSRMSVITGKDPRIYQHSRFHSKFTDGYCV